MKRHRATAEYLGGTRVRFTCPEGHVWTEDMGRKSLPKPKRLGEWAVSFLVRTWQSSGVRAECCRCEREMAA